MDKEMLMERISKLDLTGKSLDKFDKNKNSLEIACLLAELDETAGYLEVDCFDIFQFGSRFYGLGETQVKDYKSVAKAYAQKDFSGGAPSPTPGGEKFFRIRGMLILLYPDYVPSKEPRRAQNNYSFSAFLQ